MHPVLQIQEILLNIFDRCRSDISTASLPALAQTCRAFKEPALDVLWESLIEPSPLARCLPEASQSRRISGRYGSWDIQTFYSFNRSLTQQERGVLMGYTRRIRSLRDAFGTSLDWESVETFLNPSATGLLFPNLRHLSCDSATKSSKLLYMPFPCLETLLVEFRPENDNAMFRRILDSFSRVSPNISKLAVDVILDLDDVESHNFFSSCICQWRTLQDVDCRLISLNVDALYHLSRVTTLTQLNFMLRSTLLDQIPPTDPPLIFSNLRQLTVHAKSLEPISQLLSRVQLPAVTVLRAFFERCPSKLDVSSFMSNVQGLGVGRAIEGLTLDQTGSEAQDPSPILRLEDLHPCTVFRNLRALDFNLEWDVELASSEVLALASAWPHIQELLINGGWGWNTQGGIKPDDLVQLLRTCRSLNYIAVAIDTRGYTEFRRSLASCEVSLTPRFCINFVDSFIGPESVRAIAAFLADFSTRFDCSFFGSDEHSWPTEDMECVELWNEVFERARAVPRHSALFEYALDLLD